MYSQEYNLQNNSHIPNKTHNGDSDKINNATKFLANKMNLGKEITDLNIDEITYIQKYLEQVKNMKKKSQSNHPNQPNQSIQHNQHNQSNQQKSTSSNPSNPSCTNVPHGDRRGGSSMKPNYENPNMGHPIPPNNLPYDSHNLDNLDSKLPPSMGTRPGKRAHRDEVTNRSGSNIRDFGSQSLQPDYYNPYEYGSRQNQSPSFFNNTIAHQPPIIPGRLEDSSSGINQLNQFSQMGLSDNMLRDNFPGHVRNINVESALWQQDNTHTPGQRRITNSSNMGEIDRFELLPFDPQDPNHIVWPTNMPPRGGYMSRNDRLELA